MTKEEWLKRYKQAFIDIADMPEIVADDMAGASAFEDASRGFEDDPEGAAQEELSYFDY